jgi:hypothetical protein
VPALFIGVSDNSDLVRTTALIYLQVPEPKEQAAVLHRKYAVMLDQEKRRYENRVASFFFEPASRERHCLGLWLLPSFESTTGHPHGGVDPWAARMATHA